MTDSICIIVHIIYGAVLHRSGIGWAPSVRNNGRELLMHPCRGMSKKEAEIAARLKAQKERRCYTGDWTMKLVYNAKALSCTDAVKMAIDQITSSEFSNDVIVVYRDNVLNTLDEAGIPRNSNSHYDAMAAFEAHIQKAGAL